MSSRTFFDYQSKQTKNQTRKYPIQGKSINSIPRRAFSDVTNQNTTYSVQTEENKNKYIYQNDNRKNENNFPPIEKMHFAPPPKEYEGYHFEADTNTWFDLEIELEPQPLYEPMKW